MIIGLLCCEKMSSRATRSWKFCLLSPVILVSDAHFSLFLIEKPEEAEFFLRLQVIQQGPTFFLGLKAPQQGPKIFYGGSCPTKRP